MLWSVRGTLRNAIAACGLAGLLASTAAAQVSITLDQFGVGDRFRSGDWTGVRIAVRSDLPEPRAVRLEWEIPDADGDLAVSTRSFVLAPGQSFTRWLYGRLPPTRSPAELEGAVFTLRLHEEDDGVRGEELAVARVSPATAAVPGLGVGLDEGLVGLIGSGRLGLEAYEVPPPGLASIPALNERTILAGAIGVEGLPDHWEGLSSFEALVWAGDDPATRPESVSIDAGRAVLEWVRRGGMLVLVLPETGNPWSLGAAASTGRRNFLAETLAGLAFERRESVPIREMLPALSKSMSLRDRTAAMPVALFDASTLPPPWVPVLAFPAPHAAQSGLVDAKPNSIEGRFFAVERPLGFGRIAVVGLDLDALRRRSLQDGGLPQADCVWNPLLGRRGDTLTSTEYAALDGADPRRLVRRPTEIEVLGGPLIASRIDLAGEAAVGLLAAMALFGLYWLLAGPLGFGVLRRLHRERMSWLLFVAVAAVFAVVAWAGSLGLRQGRTRIVHLTFLDQVARNPAGDPYAGGPNDPQFQRAFSWFTASLPGYGTAEISLETTSGQRDLLSSWLAPPGDLRGGFPDTARYEVDQVAPNSLEVPSRATASTFAANWLGSLPPAWGDLPRVDPEAPVEPWIDLAAGTVSLRGRLIHGLASDLEDVRIIHINPWRTPLPRIAGTPAVVTDSGETPQHGRFVIVPSWPAGTPLDLEKALYPIGPASATRGSADGLAAQLRGRYYEPYAAQAGIFRPDSDRTAPEEVVRQLDMLSLYSMLTPPPYLQNPPTGRDTVRIAREVAREADLGPWLDRPCLLVIGYLRQSAIPIPITVDGSTPPSEGWTVIRWILPLPPLPPAMVPDPRPSASG